MKQATTSTSRATRGILLQGWCEYECRRHTEKRFAQNCSVLVLWLKIWGQGVPHVHHQWLMQGNFSLGRCMYSCAGQKSVNLLTYEVQPSVHLPLPSTENEALLTMRSVSKQRSPLWSIKRRIGALYLSGANFNWGFTSGLQVHTTIALHLRFTNTWGLFRYSMCNLPHEFASKMCEISLRCQLHAQVATSCEFDSIAHAHNWVHLCYPSCSCSVCVIGSVPRLVVLSQCNLNDSNKNDDLCSIKNSE